MPLYVGATKISELAGSVKLNGNSVAQLNIDGVQVWPTPVVTIPFNIPVYTQKNSGSYDRANSTSAGYLWLSGGSLYFGWESNGNENSGLPVMPAPSLALSQLIGGPEYDWDDYEYAVVSAPFTITSAPSDGDSYNESTLGIGVWLPMPTGAQTTQNIRCNSSGNSDSFNSKVWAANINSVWQVRLRGTAVPQFEITSLIETYAKSES
jgi:hypothetical protein